MAAELSCWRLLTVSSMCCNICSALPKFALNSASSFFCRSISALLCSASDAISSDKDEYCFSAVSASSLRLRSNCKKTAELKSSSALESFSSCPSIAARIFSSWPLPIMSKRRRDSASEAVISSCRLESSVYTRFDTSSNAVFVFSFMSFTASIKRFSCSERTLRIFSPWPPSASAKMRSVSPAISFTFSRCFSSCAATACCWFSRSENTFAFCSAAAVDKSLFKDSSASVELFLKRSYVAATDEVSFSSALESFSSCPSMAARIFSSWPLPIISKRRRDSAREAVISSCLLESSVYTRFDTSSSAACVFSFTSFTASIKRFSCSERTLRIFSPWPPSASAKIRSVSPVSSFTFSRCFSSCAATACC